MRAYGLTGNIGCGKSTVANLLSQYSDVVVIDCDKLAKEIVSSESYRKKICSILGEDVFQSGRTDFNKIAKIIFQNSEKKRLFEALIHPLVWERVEEIVGSEPRKIYIVESAIIFETLSEDRFLDVITVSCSETEQYRRLRENRGMTDREISSRLSHQIPSLNKEIMSRFVVNTDCTLEKLSRRVHVLYTNLKEG